MSQNSSPPTMRIQFSLKSLFIGIACCAVIFAWLGIQLEKASVQSEAVAHLRKLGFVVVYSPVEEVHGVTTPPIYRSAFIRDLFGEDFIYSVGGVALSSGNAMDNDDDTIRKSIPWLKRLDSPIRLTLDATGVSPVVFAELAEVEIIQQLNLSPTRNARRLLPYLVHFRTLRQLFLIDCNLDDRDIDVLCRYNQLLQLDISGNEFTEGGVEKLRHQRENSAKSTNGLEVIWQKL